MRVELNRADLVALGACQAVLDFYDSVTGGTDFVTEDWTPTHSAMLGARSPAFLKGLENSGRIPRHAGIFRLAMLNSIARRKAIGQ